MNCKLDTRPTYARWDKRCTDTDVSSAPRDICENRANTATIRVIGISVVIMRGVYMTLWHKLRASVVGTKGYADLAQAIDTTNGLGYMMCIVLLLAAASASTMLRATMELPLPTDNAAVTDMIQ